MHEFATTDDTAGLLALPRGAVVGATPHAGRASNDVPAFRRDQRTSPVRGSALAVRI